jgi:hypothetical protein
VLSVPLLALLAAPHSAQQAVPAAATDPAIRAADISAHVRALAADELAGRATGSPGAELAARYLADALAAAGAEPAGDVLPDGKRGFLQDASIVRRVWKAQPVLAFVAKSGERLPAAWGIDYELDDARAFRGRIDLVLGSAAGATLAVDAKERGVVWEGGSRTQREAWLSEQGRAEGRGLDALVLIGGKKPGTARSELPAPRLSRTNQDSAPAPIVVRLRGELCARAAAGELVALELELALDEQRGGAANVVGRLSARGAQRQPGAIVLSAHYDHLGTREPREPRAPSAPGAAAEGPTSAPDTIYNGADDDASGCAAVLELVAALAARAERAREIVILLATGEEVGLLGTEHYLRHPVVPLEATICNLNFEMLGRPDALAGGTGGLWLTGFERSNLGAAWQAAGLAIVRDPRPEQQFFQRSDNYAFARRGIVAQTLSSFDLHSDYHKPSDEWDTLDYAHMERAVQAALDALVPLVDGALAPAWLPGGNPAERASEPRPASGAAR